MDNKQIGIPRTLPATSNLPQMDHKEPCIHFTFTEIDKAIDSLKPNKAPGFDRIIPEFIMHLGPIAKTWLNSFYNPKRRPRHTRFFDHWKLQLNPSKSVTSLFYLNKNEANTSLTIRANNNILQHDPKPKYIGVFHDRTLSFKKHIIETGKKISQKQPNHTAEYAGPVWFNSSHAKSIDTKLNTTLRIITGCLKSTQTHWLSTLSHIAPPHLSRKFAASKLFNKILTSNLPIRHDILNHQTKRLKSRHSIWESLYPNTVYPSIHEAWKAEWSNSSPKNRHLYPDPHQNQSTTI
ncbi:hypothetical protein RF11_01446 [Thelohanellus kitauei]|uniref:Reverse transcriptase domain-containing protein n=1 Tax=Thelohanellus kitauei TaxID=669202 RepID=A0A0C2IDU7_THEKT|nr:hypothetical protein RF11_01446 [Thelohanellus kitauei]